MRINVTSSTTNVIHKGQIRCDLQFAPVILLQTVVLFWRHVNICYFLLYYPQYESLYLQRHSWSFDGATFSPLRESTSHFMHKLGRRCLDPPSWRRFLFFGEFESLAEAADGRELLPRDSLFSTAGLVTQKCEKLPSDCLLFCVRNLTVWHWSG